MPLRCVPVDAFARIQLGLRSRAAHVVVHGRFVVSPALERPLSGQRRLPLLPLRPALRGPRRTKTTQETTHGSGKRDARLRLCPHVRP